MVLSASFLLPPGILDIDLQLLSATARALWSRAAHSLYRTATGPTEDYKFDSRHGQDTFLFSKASKQALGATQSPWQRAPEILSPGRSYRCVKLTIHLLPLNSRMRTIILPRPYMPSLHWVNFNVYYT